MYPLTLIKLSKNKIIKIVLKDGQVITGKLVLCDVAMNMHLKSVTVEKPDGVKFEVNECYLKGQNVNYVQIDPKVLGMQHIFNKPAYTPIE